jgi:hypothetical protein
MSLPHTAALSLSHTLYLSLSLALGELLPAPHYAMGSGHGGSSNVGFLLLLLDLLLRVPTSSPPTFPNSARFRKGRFGERKASQVMGIARGWLGAWQRWR